MDMAGHVWIWLPSTGYIAVLGLSLHPNHSSKQLIRFWWLWQTVYFDSKAPKAFFTLTDSALSQHLPFARFGAVPYDAITVRHTSPLK
jgi:hypothetical protein